MTDETHIEPALTDLVDVLTLTELGTAKIAVTGIAGENAALLLGSESARVFEGKSQWMPSGRVFGGQVLAQCVMAAGLTIPDDGDGPRYIHSLHGYFLRPGDDKLPIRFAVEEMRDGRSFSARRVHAIQKGVPIMSFNCSFQEQAEGLDHQQPMPQTRGPEGLSSLVDAYGDGDHEDAATVRHLTETRPIEQRHVEGDIYLRPGRELVAYNEVWMRAKGSLPHDPLLHSAVLAYMSDYSLLEPVLRRHGRAWRDPAMRVASLDHSMWFHRPARADDWVFYVQESPSASGDRGLSIGHMYRQDGTLAVTAAQEGMIRVGQS